MKERIENALKEMHMSKRQLALKTGIIPSDLYSAINGTRPMFPKYRRLISEALDIPESELFDEANHD